MSDLRNRLLARVVAPADEPLTLAETKNYLRITHHDDDILVSDLIVAARMSAEQWLKASLLTQSWKLAYDDYIPECLSLPMGPISGITGVTVVNRDATTQSIDSALYYLNAAQDTLKFDSAVVGFRIETVYTAGYGNAEDVPASIKQGMLAHIAAMFDSRGETGPVGLPPQSLTLYAPYRRIAL